MTKNVESVTKGLQWVYWEGIARGFENRSKWKNAAMKWHNWFHVFTPDRLQTVGPLKENRRIGWEPNIGPLILVCSSFPHICSPPRQQNCHQGGKSLKSLKRLFNWRIFILSLTRRLWEWSAPVAPFISPWSPIEPTNIGQPPNCNEISLWAIFTGNVILYYTACLSKEDGVQFYLKIPPIFLVLFVQFLSCESIFPQSTTSR